MNNNHYKIYKYLAKLTKALENNKKNDCPRYLVHLKYHINSFPNTNSAFNHIGGKQSTDLDMFKKINQMIKENPNLDLSTKNSQITKNKEQIELYNKTNLEKIKNEIIELEKNIILLQENKLKKKEEFDNKKILTINTILNKLDTIFNLIYGKENKLNTDRLMNQLQINLNK